MKKYLIFHGIFVNKKKQNREMFIFNIYLIIFSHVLNMTFKHYTAYLNITLHICNLQYNCLICISFHILLPFIIKITIIIVIIRLLFTANDRLI